MGRDPSDHRIIGSSDHRNLDGIYTDEFLGSLKARNLWRKSLMKYGLWPEINHRNLNGIYTDVLGVAYGKMFWSSEDRVRARFHYAESRQNKP